MASLKLNEPIAEPLRDPYMGEVWLQRAREWDTNNWDGVTYRIRRPRITPVDSIALNTANLRFSNALRAAADLWHNTLTQADRNHWKAINADRDGSRPNMLVNAANGWNLFAMFALGLIMDEIPMDWTSSTTEGFPLTSITFDSADADTQLMHFTRTYAGDITEGAVNTIFIHQVDPRYILSSALTRFTMAAGYHQVAFNSPAVDSFTAEARFPFNIDDVIVVLIREHVAALEVNNRVQYVTAT